MNSSDALKREADNNDGTDNTASAGSSSASAGTIHADNDVATTSGNDVSSSNNGAETKDGARIDDISEGEEELTPLAMRVCENDCQATICEILFDVSHLHKALALSFGGVIMVVLGRWVLHVSVDGVFCRR